jgi:diguanylate cyclase (GGDEF)-like protein
MLRDTNAELRVDQVIARRAEFVAPQSAYATLGMLKHPVWLRIALQPDSTPHNTWILDLDYALLNRIDVHVVQDGRIIQQSTLGNMLKEAQRPIASRTHALSIDFQPSASGGSTELFIRVESVGAKILPITLSRLSSFHKHALAEQTLQGALASLALFLVLYSLLKWWTLGESLYAKYALLVFSSAMFSVHFFGIGAQFLWTDIDWLERRLAGVMSLTAAGATALFILDAMRADLRPHPRMALRVVAGTLFFSAALHAMDVITIQQVGYLMTTLGLVPALLGLPSAIARQRSGDATGGYFIAAWVGYFIASAIMVGVVRGHIGANFWTLHSFQFGATFDMLIFLRIALLRSELVHRAAQHATRERESLLSMAQSDPLTGLLNRRGLSAALNAALTEANAGRVLAVYMLDLDGFKPVNDQHGHDVGDELLIAVAGRLRGRVRAGDAVARLGGDEFVIMSTGFSMIEQAADLGAKLLDAFQRPFALRGQEFHVGATIGYALAPHDADTGHALIKIADDALYAGKHSGKNCIRRAAAPTVNGA